MLIQYWEKRENLGKKILHLKNKHSRTPVPFVSKQIIFALQQVVFYDQEKNIFQRSVMTVRLTETYAFQIHQIL